MAKIVARMAKMKAGNLGGIQRHNQRETENHSNKDIDVGRSYLNYDLVNEKPVNYRERVHEIIDRQRSSTRAIRKDAVLVDEWIITSDTGFFEMADQKMFFEDSVAYFSQRCGAQNIAYATVHLDETTPHMHLGVVPMHEGRLSSKQVFSRQALQEIQEEFPKYLQDRGHAIERGSKGSERKHLTVPEYKQTKREVAKLEQEKNRLVEMSLNTPIFDSKAFEKEIEEIPSGLFKKAQRETGRLIIDSEGAERLKVSSLEIDGMKEKILTQDTEIRRLRNQVYGFDVERADYEKRIWTSEQKVERLESELTVEREKRKIADQQINDFGKMITNTQRLFREFSRFPGLSAAITQVLGVNVFGFGAGGFMRWLSKYEPKAPKSENETSRQKERQKQIDRSRDTGMSR